MVRMKETEKKWEQEARFFFWFFFFLPSALLLASGFYGGVKQKFRLVLKT